jgi:hypothetical protein
MRAPLLDIIWFYIVTILCFFFFFITEHDKSAATTTIKYTYVVDEELDGTEAVLGGKACSRYARVFIGQNVTISFSYSLLNITRALCLLPI